MRGNKDDNADDDGGGYDVEKGGDADDDAAGKPRFDPSQNVRFRHEVAFLVATCTVAFLDLLLAGFMTYEHFGNQGAVWGLAVAISVVEGVYTAVSCALIEFHVWTHKHWDLVVPLTFIWSGSLSVNIAFILGALEERATHPTLFAWTVFLIVASQSAGLALAIVGTKTNILLLTDPHPEKHGYQPAKHHSWHKHGHKRRHHRDEEDP